LKIDELRPQWGGRIRGEAPKHPPGCFNAGTSAGFLASRLHYGYKENTDSAVLFFPTPSQEQTLETLKIDRYRRIAELHKSHSSPH
jgi:hypothetical protein